MRFSFIRTSAAAVVASIALAACGGHGMVPTSTAPGMTGEAVPASTSPCANPKLPWYFKGACVPGVVTSAGATYTLPAYKNISGTIKLGANTAKGKIPFVLADATGKGDISPLAVKSAFPPYGEKTCATANQCPGTAAYYLEIVNGGTANIKLTKASTLTIKAPYPKSATACGPALINSSGKWTSYALFVAAKPSNGTLTLTIPGGTSQFELVAGAGYIAILCQ